MTDILELFSGVAIIIDDEINQNITSLNGIQKIVKSLKEKNVPFVSYSELPNDKMIKNFHPANFILLDWNLSGTQPIPEAAINDNIQFIKNLNEICFLPIFIFSDEDPHTIEVKLEEERLYNSKNNNHVFVKRKSELDSCEKLFSEIGTWLKNTPSVYIVKEWEKAIKNAKKEMLWALYSIFPEWPGILSETVAADGVDINSELIAMLQKNLAARIVAPSFDNEIITKNTGKVNKEDIRKLIECERFIRNDLLPDYPFTGDVYEIDDAYYINIRPDCDIIRNKKDLYLLKGNIVDESRINSDVEKAIIFDSGEFIEKINLCYIAFIDGKIIEIKLRDLQIKQWDHIKSKRIARLLPPYITKIQQKYSFYLQRQGLPAIPEAAIR